MINCVIVFDGRVNKVDCDDTHQWSGVDPGRAIVLPLKPTKVTFFTMILYNSERHLTAS